MDHNHLHARARERGVDPVVYRLSRAVLEPFFLLYFRMSRTGRGHIPRSGPVIVAANHRSFLDPFVIGTLSRRPLYYVAKQELFRHRAAAWWLNALGAFPVRRGEGDGDSMVTARAILARGDAVLFFPEGTRVRPGSLGIPRRGVGRLALETGAPVVPVAVIGTEAVRDGWRLRPHKVRVRAGRPLRFPRRDAPDAAAANAATERIWASVMLQWESLGGLPPLRRAAVIGAGPGGTAIAGALARAGLEVDLGARAGEEPDAPIAPGVRALAAGELELSRHDLVVLAAGRDAAADRLAARIPPRAALLIVAGADDPRPVAPPRTRARLAGALLVGSDPGEQLRRGGQVALLAQDDAIGRQLGDVLARAGVRALPATATRRDGRRGAERLSPAHAA